VSKIKPVRKSGNPAYIQPGRRKRGGPKLVAESAPPTGLKQLVEEIDQQASQLIDDPTGMALERYKRAVSQFLDQAITSSIRVQSETSAGLTRNVFSIVARIDLALAELTDAVLAKQQDVLKIRAVVDQIKGLVVDRYR